jgi:tRNA threonylcarbamoyladenosine modification (KEOPS) complex  Pcc1 subunit
MSAVREMKAQTIIRLRFAAQKNLNAVLKALAPETLKPATSRSLVKVESQNSVLILRFEAADTSALRAVINSYLHWTLLAMDTISRLESRKKT